MIDITQPNSPGILNEEVNPARKLAVSFANGFVREDRRGGLAVDVTEGRLPADLNRCPPELSADLEDLNNVPQRDVMLLLLQME